MSDKKLSKEIMDSLTLFGLKSEGTIDAAAQDIVDALGRLMFNCGLLEALSKNWIWEFETDEVKRDELCKVLWYKRTKGLKVLIDNQNYRDEFKDRCHKVIQFSRKVMKFRITVA